MIKHFNKSFNTFHDTNNKAPYNFEAQVLRVLKLSLRSSSQNNNNCNDQRGQSKRSQMLSDSLISIENIFLLLVVPVSYSS